MAKSAGVLGGGSWGTALAKHLADKGFAVTMWCRREEHAASINEKHVNERYLPGIELPRTLFATSDPQRAISGGKELILSVIPSQVTREALTGFAPLFEPGVPVVGCSKGIENGTLALMSDVFQEVLPEGVREAAAFLSGPSFAKEVAQGLPTAVTIASRNAEVAQRVQTAFTGPTFRAYSTEDVIGVEVGGALKNVMAIAAGAADGIGFGHNTIAALITRGLAEITRAATAMGANPLTMMGLAGMGDLVLTCTGGLSRNRHVGTELGKGKRLQQVLDEMNQVAEGVGTARSAFALSKKLDVEMPITDAVYRLLYEDLPAHEAVVQLMTRDKKHERA